MSDLYKYVSMSSAWCNKWGLPVYERISISRIPCRVLSCLEVLEYTAHRSQLPSCGARLNSTRWASSLLAASTPPLNHFIFVMHHGWCGKCGTLWDFLSARFIGQFIESNEQHCKCMHLLSVVHNRASETLINYYQYVVFACFVKKHRVGSIPVYMSLGSGECVHWKFIQAYF